MQFRDGHAFVNGIAVAESDIKLGDPGFVYNNTTELAVPNGHVFVAGDNRALSTDSRFSGHGPVPLENLIGRVTEIYWSDDWDRVGLWVGSSSR